MKLVTLTRESLGATNGRDGSPSVTFSHKGLITLSSKACVFLGIITAGKDSAYVCIFQDQDKPTDFFVSAEGGGAFRLRRNSSGGYMFNCSALAKLVREQTWACHGHAVGAVMPNNITLVICERPVDDGKNKTIFALIRKKI
jgi:hypothetical protein